MSRSCKLALTVRFVHQNRVFISLPHLCHMPLWSDPRTFWYVIAVNVYISVQSQELSFELGRCTCVNVVWVLVKGNITQLFGEVTKDWNYVCVLLGISPASVWTLPTFRNPLSVPSSRAGCKYEVWIMSRVKIEIMFASLPLWGFRI